MAIVNRHINRFGIDNLISGLKNHHTFQVFGFFPGAHIAQGNRISVIFSILLSQQSFDQANRFVCPIGA